MVATFVVDTLVPPDRQRRRPPRSASRSRTAPAAPATDPRDAEIRELRAAVERLAEGMILLQRTVLALAERIARIESGEDWTARAIGEVVDHFDARLVDDDDDAGPEAETAAA